MNYNNISHSAENWQAFLDFAANLYGYNFTDQLLVYDHNSAATSLATYDQWNKLGRRINRDAAGCRISNNTVLFDISETNGTEIKKWDFLPEHVPFFCDLLNRVNVASNVISGDGYFQLEFYDYICEALNNDKSISGRVSNDIADFCALSIEYSCLRRMGLKASGVNFDFTDISSFDDDNLELIGTITATYSNALLRCAKKVVLETTPDQLQARQRPESAPSYISDFEEVIEEKIIYTEEADEEQEPVSSEPSKTEFTLTEDYISEGADSNTEDYSESPSEQIIEVTPVSEVIPVSSLSDSEKTDIMREALMLFNDSIDKDRLVRFYQNNDRRSTVTAFTKSAYHNKHLKTNSNNYPCISGYIGKNAGLVINYAFSDSNTEKLIFDWSAVSAQIRELISENTYINKAAEQEEKAVETEAVTVENHSVSAIAGATANYKDQPWDVRVSLTAIDDSISTYLSESFKPYDEYTYIYGSYSDYDTAAAAMEAFRIKRDSGEDMSEIYSKIKPREKDIVVNKEFYLNGELYYIYEVSKLLGYVDIAKVSERDNTITYIMRSEENRPETQRIAYRSLFEYLNIPERFASDPRNFRYDGELKPYDSSFVDRLERRALTDVSALSKKERKELAELTNGVADSYRRWSDIYENGSSDPFYRDGVSLNLIRNHIIYYKNQLSEKYPEYALNVPRFLDDLPNKVSNQYMAFAEGERIGISDSSEVDDGIYTVVSINGDGYSDTITLRNENNEESTVRLSAVKTKWQHEAKYISEQAAKAGPETTAVIYSGAAHRNFIALKKLFPEFIRRESAALSISTGIEDSVTALQWTGENTFRIFSYYPQNGRKVIERELSVSIDTVSEAVNAAAYENGSINYTEFSPDSDMSSICDKLLREWLRGIELSDRTVEAREFDDIGISVTTVEGEQEEANVSTDDILSFRKDDDGNIYVYDTTHTDEDGEFTAVAFINTINQIAVKFAEDFPDGYRDMVFERAREETPTLNMELLLTNSSLSLLDITYDDGFTVLSEYQYINGEAVLVEREADIRTQEVPENTAAQDRFTEYFEKTVFPAITDVQIAIDGARNDNERDFFNDRSKRLLSQFSDELKISTEELEALIDDYRDYRRTNIDIPFTVGDEISYGGRSYEIEKIDVGRNEIYLLDRNTGWYPITNIERLSRVLSDHERQAVEEEIEIAADNRPENFIITNDELGYGTDRIKFRRNIRAVKLLKELEAEGRTAEPEEQEVLSNYVGWGGLQHAFEENNSSWADEYKELKEVLTEEEYESAAASVLNSHYTSPVIIRAMYKALDKFGFTGGRILEPSCGTGNFLGCAPADKSANYSFTGIEIDSISGRIAKQLYPRAAIQITGFEDAKLKENSFDVAVGNVPFGNYAVTDKKYNRQNNLIHDYFFLKSLDMVRPNGVVAFITSKGTLDKQSDKVRKAISEKATLIGAIRLPDNAFLENAGTETVTDIIFLQKREIPSTERVSWLETDPFYIGYGVSINKYFADNPDMVCGTMSAVMGRYGYRLSVKSDDDVSLENRLDDCLEKLSAKIEFKEPLRNANEEAKYIPSELRTLNAPDDLKNHSYIVIDDTVFRREGAVIIETDTSYLNSRQLDQFKGLIMLSGLTRKAVEAQSEFGSDDKFESLRKRLNSAYDQFIDKYGYIHDLDKKSKTIRELMEKDDNYPLLRSMEVPDNGDSYKKGAMFFGRTINTISEVDHCDTVVDGFYAALNSKGVVDLELIADLTDKTIDDVIGELNGTLIFRDPLKASTDITVGWETNDSYLSGNVKEKLKLATAYAQMDPAYNVNVKALADVQPERLYAGDISCQLGSSWIPTDIIEAFIKDNFGLSIEVEHNLVTSRWNIPNKANGSYYEITRSTYGTEDANALEILEDSLCLRDSKVYRTITENGKERRILDKDRTTLVSVKQDAIKSLFKDWVFKDADRTQRLEDIYNDKFNSERPRSFDGSHMVFPGMANDIDLRPHQKDAVARAIYGDNTLLAHAVGAGKTYEMITIAMEMRRLGTAKKPLFVVPNHLLGQWTEDFNRLYPAATVLAATTKDFDKENRKEFTARIATGDYDAIIMAFSTFSMIEISPERRADYYKQEIDECMAIINSSGRDLSFKDAQIRRKRLEKSLEAIEYVKDRDSVVYFEQLGVDALFVDEAHNYKNLHVPTKLSRVAGISTSHSKRAEDMYLKIQYISELNNGNKGVVFATGTPISNSITEMYVMQKYLQPDYLRSKGHEHFDSWIADFGEISTSIELSPTGTGFRAKTRCSSFKNVPELMMMFKRCADVQTAEMLDLPIPKLKDDKYDIILCQPSPEQEEYIKLCGERADAVHDRKVAPEEDNMLKISNDGKLCALDMRLVDPTALDRPDSKVNRCVQKVLDMYAESNEIRGTHAIMLDTSTPKANKGEHKDFCLYDDIKEKLIKGGIPSEEIAYIHDAKNDNQRIKLFNDLNEGKVRVIIGSTEKMGTGSNFQNRLYSLHHLDVPWRPSDIEQREGRILRQGNCNSEVRIFRYATEKTFDAYSWQTIENKQKAISQCITSRPTGRTIDDIDDATLNYAEIKSLATGDDRIRQQIELTLEVSKLKSEKSQFLAERSQLNRRLNVTYPADLKIVESKLHSAEADIKTASDNPPPAEFSMEIKGVVFNDRHKAGKAIFAMKNVLKEDDREYIGKYRGFDLMLKTSKQYNGSLIDGATSYYKLRIQGDGKYEMPLGHGYEALFKAIDDALDDQITDIKKSMELQAATIKKNMEEAQASLDKEFEKETELKEKSEQLSRLTAELSLNDTSDLKYAGIISDEDQEQGNSASRGRH